MYLSETGQGVGDRTELAYYGNELNGVLHSTDIVPWFQIQNILVSWYCGHLLESPKGSVTNSSSGELHYDRQPTKKSLSQLHIPTAPTRFMASNAYFRNLEVSPIISSLVVIYETNFTAIQFQYTSGLLSSFGWHFLYLQPAYLLRSTIL
jgi:hypothetical protein